LGATATKPLFVSGLAPSSPEDHVEEVSAAAAETMEKFRDEP